MKMRGFTYPSPLPKTIYELFFQLSANKHTHAGETLRLDLFTTRS